MVRLMNIQLSEKIISCNFFPEGSEAPGYLSVDVETNKVKEYYLPDGYEYCENHLHKAKDRLLQCIATNQIPPKEEALLVMWY